MLRLSARNALGFLIVAAVGALLLVILRNYRGPKPEEELHEMPRQVDLALKQVNFTETEGDLRRWTLLADTAAHSMEQGKTTVENVRMTFFDRLGEQQSTLEARQGEIRTEAREVKAWGEVTVRHRTGYEFYTEKLQFRGSEGKLETAEPVRLIAPAMEVTGTGLELNVDDRSFSILKAVSARIDPQRIGAGEN